MKRRIGIALLATFCTFGPAIASATILHPFVTGGMSRISWEKKERNYLTDIIKLTDGSNSWQVGGGFRLRPHAPGSSAISPLGVQLRVAYGQGDLPTTRVSGRRWVGGHTGEPFTSTETYSYHWWSVFPGMLIRIPMPRSSGSGFHPQVELSISPGIQQVKFLAHRDWVGPTGFSETGNADDETHVRYGLLDLGGSVRPTSLPLALTAGWQPFRARLSTSHKLKDDNWTTANFSTFEKSFSVGLEYEF